MKFILGKKIGMTRIFNESGESFPVTILNVAGNKISQIKNSASDHYTAVQVAYGIKKHNPKSVSGHLKKANIGSAFRIKEFRGTDLGEIKVGEEISITTFSVGDMVTVTSTSKGKGFSGTVKRHNFQIGPKSHGSNNMRQPGSIGATTPAHVIKGRRMPGRMGGETTTLKGIEVLGILSDDHVMLLKGPIPGPNGAIIKIFSK